MKYPTPSELVALRKGLRKRKTPNVFDGMWCSEPGVGGVKVTRKENDYRIEWVTFDNGIKSSLKIERWSALCTNPELEMQRYEVGCVVAAVLRIQGQQVEDSVGHPLEGPRRGRQNLPRPTPQ
jgi:hypothetical protein